jgi:hypothetical protein
MIALLLGCDCPSFAEMSVVDTTGRGDVAAAVEVIANRFPTPVARDEPLGPGGPRPPLPSGRSVASQGEMS